MKIKLFYDLGWLTADIIVAPSKNLEAYEIRELWENVYEKIVELKVPKYNRLDELKDELMKINVENAKIEQVNFIIQIDERGGLEIEYSNQ
ncbi:MAG: hypothetical protein ACPL3B_07500 [Fervidobacterium sp.]